MADTRASAVAEARKLKEALLDNGVPMVSIEVMRGRPSEYGVWNSQFVVSDFAHHIVSRYSPSNKTPALALVKRGRSDLPGPLCNGYGGFDLIARIITLGWANHPGEGGPMRVPSGSAKPRSYVIPRDSARRYAFGWEFEGGLVEADWDREYTARNGKKMNFHEFMARCLNGTQQMYDLPFGAHAEHKTWAPTRKTDRMGYTKDSAIAKMRKYKGPYLSPVAIMPSGTRIDVEAVREQFRIAAGFQEGRVRQNNDVEQIQRALNRRYDASLEVDGKVDPNTLRAWRNHEARVGGEDKQKIPDESTLRKLFPR